MDVQTVFQSLVTLGVMIGLGLTFTLAYVAEREGRLDWMVYVVLMAINGAVLFTGALLSVAGSIADLAPVNGAPDAPLKLPPGAGLHMGWVLMATSVVAVLVLLPPVRRLLGRVVPLDPGRLVHAVALDCAVYVLGLAGVAFVMLPVFENAGSAQAMSDQLSPMNVLLTTWAQMVGFVVIAFLGVGLFVARDWRAALARLGVTRSINWRWFLAATVLGLVVGTVIDQAWARFLPASMKEVENLTEIFYKPLLQLGLVGALTIGFGAGISEELIFRGAAQPRMGLVLTTILFAALHPQYKFSPALLQVVLLGVMLGVVRQRTNTTTSMAVHAVYNLALALVAIYGPHVGS